MIDGARRIPVQHLSIRVPWHDTDWAGTICKRPASNTACRSLKHIAEKKDDGAEAKLAGASLKNLPFDQLPPCVVERANFMAPFSIKIRKQHPYAYRKSHSHFCPTNYTMRPYTASCIPFRWMTQKSCKELVESYGLDFQLDREPDLEFNTGGWIQERVNQRVMLDTFFSAIHPGKSLCFFYAKDTPLSTSAGRVIIGVGIVRKVDAPVEYEYSIQKPPFRSVIWERNVEHSIRQPEFKNGFLFPYRELFDLALEKGIDPEQFLAFAPDDAFHSFSYVSEHVSHDHAIATLLNCHRALKRIQDVLPGHWTQISAWIDDQLNQLWHMRGAFPGFGSALRAFLGNGGNLVAYQIAEECAKNNANATVDPWPYFEQIMRDPSKATGMAKDLIGGGFAQAWSAISSERKELLKLISRFSLESEQTIRFFDPKKRKKHQSDVSDAALIENPYLLYELDRSSVDPISFMTIDRGILPGRAVLNAHPLPDRSRLTDKIDHRRVRALMVAVLEQGAEQGHTLLPSSQLTAFISDMPLETDCPVGLDVLNSLDGMLEGTIESAEMSGGDTSYQLRRFVDTASLIRRTVDKRVSSGSKRLGISHDFLDVVNNVLGSLPNDPDEAEIENRARIEKAVALKEIYESRLSVLTGAAGTGKTTVLNMLCRLPDVKDGGILLLAPTGKARVQLQTKTGDGGFTIAQFLMRYGERYDCSTGRYVVTASSDRCSDYRTVIVDECSMLTEEQLAALFDGLSGVNRWVLVGDPHQLPPIGSGRPFVDIVNKLAPVGVGHGSPRGGRGYAELTIPRRQLGTTRADLLLASWFAGNPDPAADEIWDRLETDKMNEVRFESWTVNEDLQKKLLELIVEELKLDDSDDEKGFECSLGATIYKGNTSFWRGKEGDKVKADEWQIITPVRGAEHGVEVLNRIIQQTFRKTWLSWAMSPRNRINRPVGPQGIIYGDKVINLQNKKRKVYPDPDYPPYVANGEVGVVVGHRKTKKKPKLLPILEVEFASQPYYDYKFGIADFDSDKGPPPLELAYALTVHKSQGSEFGTTFVILPNPCWILSRELLYTALTRQKERIIILYQGDVRELRRYASEKYSDIAHRLTNLFNPPTPVPFEVDGKETFFEESLIHRTKRGELVRSKSEVIIANELLAQGIDRYEYEEQLKLPEVGKTFYPDFTIMDDDTGTCYYWEHLGLLNNPDYKTRWERKLSVYRNANILPYDEGGGDVGTLIVTRDDESGGIDSKSIANLIRNILAS